MLTEVEGVFVKIAFADDAEVSLVRGQPHRPAARFNRQGQDALCLSPDELSARVAIGEYVKPEDPPRVLLNFEVERATLYDFRHPQSAEVYDLARQSWRKALQAGEQPKSWKAADIVRELGYFGLIDPSLRRPGLWHIALMRWNEAGAPGVRQIGDPVPINVEPDFR